MRKHALMVVYVFVILFAITKETSAQNTPEKRWNVAVGYSSFSKSVLELSGSKQTVFYPQVLTNVGYRFTEFWEMGLGFGYAHRLRIRTEERSYNDNSTNYAGWVYAKLQVLPLLIQNYDFPFDVYLSGKTGRYLINYTFDNDRYRNWHYGAYAGASFYFLKNFGIYGEIGYGNESIFEVGLNWRF